MTKSIYLDHNATAPLRPEAAAALSAAFALPGMGNPSSVHAAGRAARALLEEARERLAALYGAQPRELIFTSGGSEANNQALAAAGEGPVLVSAGEHDSVLAAVPGAERLALTPEGQVDLDALRARLASDPKPALVSVLWVNNETGVINPVPEIARLVHEAGALFHCDAVQAAGKLPLDFAACGADLLSLSAHKVGGPAGCGLLLLRDGLEAPAFVKGGGQERRRRAGTENLLGALAYAAAAEAAEAERAALSERLSGWRDAFEARLCEAAPEVKVFGAAAPRVANTSCVAWASAPSETQVMAMDLAGFCISAGSACSSGKVTPSHVLSAMGASPQEAGGALRISLGWDSRESDLTDFAEAWLQFYRRRRAAA